MGNLNTLDKKATKDTISINNKYNEKKNESQKFALPTSFEKKRAEQAEKAERDERDKYEQSQSQRRHIVRISLIIQIIISASLTKIFFQIFGENADTWDGAVIIWAAIFALAFTVYRVYNLLHFNAYYKKVKEKRWA
jgi:cation transport ATPase